MTEDLKAKLLRLGVLSVRVRRNSRRGHTSGAPARERITPRPARKSSAVPQRTILVADDDATIRTIIRHFLEKQGFAVVEARDGLETLEAVCKYHVDLILLDTVMGSSGGYWTCELLRAEPATRDLPIVMCTGKSTKEAVLRALRSGARDYLLKPFSKEDLLCKVRSALAAK